MAKKDSNEVGFTTDYFHRCCICQREIDHEHRKCECGANILHVRLQPKQDELLQLAMSEGPDAPTKILYGGSRAAGKSRGGRDVSLIVLSEQAQRYENISACIMRRNWTQCESTHLIKLKGERPELTDFYTNKKYEFPAMMKSPILAFQYADTDDDVERMERGPEWFLSVVDQAEQILGRNLQKIKSSNRWPAAATGAAKSLYLYNPGGAGTPYLKRVGYDKKYEGNERASDFAFIQAYGWDNVFWFLNQGIEIDGHPLTWEIFYDLPGDLPELDPKGNHDAKWLETIPDNHRFKIFVTQTSEGRSHWEKPESLRMADLFGRFDAFEGQAFAGVFSRDRVVIH